jgi:DNA-binding transcriptional LysR family regulator
MTLDDLRVFNAVSEATSLSAVARDLGCTQSAVSQHLSRLERELAVVLLERGQSGVALTPAGEILYRASSEGLGALAMAVREIQRLRDGEVGRLSISTGGTTVRHFMGRALVQFRLRHPEVAVHFEPESSTARCLDAVAARRADIAFVTISGDVRGFELRPALEMPLMLLVRCDDPRARRRAVRARDLADIQYIALSESTASHRITHDLLHEVGVSLAPTTRVDDFDTASVFVALGLGHAIVPAVHGRDFERTGRVKAIRIQGMPPLVVGWAARQFRLLPPVALEFMDTLAASARRQWRGIPGLRVVRTNAA